MFFDVVEMILEDIKWRLEGIIGGIRYSLIGLFGKPNFTFVGNRSYIRVPEELALAVMPLYCERTFMCLGLGHRLGSYITGREDVWWDFGCKGIAEKSFRNVADAITQFVFPWFQELFSEEAYRKRLIKDKSKNLSDIRPRNGLRHCRLKIKSS